jgi:hypothetical protein
VGSPCRNSLERATWASFGPETLLSPRRVGSRHEPVSTRGTIIQRWVTVLLYRLCVVRVATDRGDVGRRGESRRATPVRVAGSDHERDTTVRSTKRFGTGGSADRRGRSDSTAVPRLRRGCNVHGRRPGGLRRLRLGGPVVDPGGRTGREPVGAVGTDRPRRRRWRRRRRQRRSERGAHCRDQRHSGGPDAGRDGHVRRWRLVRPRRRRPELRVGPRRRDGGDRRHRRAQLRGGRRLHRHADCHRRGRRQRTNSPTSSRPSAA